MGLIDFLKTAGERLTGIDQPSKQDLIEEEAKAAESLEKLIHKMIIPISDLQVRFTKGVATIYGNTVKQSHAEMAALVVGNVNGIKQVDNRIVVLNPEPEATYYTVAPGDSLSKIAKVHYGDAMKYPAIFEANRPMLSDPDKIYPGQVLRIP